ncbi:sugar phosphate nucleotidyltransferase [Alphaproteobacteria bacterium]|nr:sugar phosphate nucleotidyltransferase [Alphaproteobacteria bacterium]
MNFKKYTISLDSSILDAIRALNKVFPKLLIVENSGIVIGTLTDGDIRRGLLRGFTLDESCANIIKKNFKFLEVEKYLNSNNVDLNNEYSDVLLVPILERKKLKSIFFPNKSNAKGEVSSSRNIGLIMAGGFGTRMSFLTKNKPKALLKINGVPMIEHIIKKLVSCGIYEIYISTFYLKNQIIRSIGDGSRFNVKIKYIKEESPLGTGGALNLIDDNIFDNVLVINCDVMTDLNLLDFINFHLEKNSVATMAMKEHLIVNPFGVVDFKDGNYQGILEKPVYKSFVNAGLYMLSCKALRVIKANEVIDMPAVFERLVSVNEKPKVFPIFENWRDIGTPEDLSKANS